MNKALLGVLCAAVAVGCGGFHEKRIGLCSPLLAWELDAGSQLGVDFDGAVRRAGEHRWLLREVSMSCVPPCRHDLAGVVDTWGNVWLSMRTADLEHIIGQGVVLRVTLECERKTYASASRVLPADVAACRMDDVLGVYLVPAWESASTAR